MKASIIVVGVAAAVLAGCGSIGSSAGASGGAAAARTSPSPGRGAFANGVSGQVSQVATGKVTVDDQNGSVTVAYDSSTTVLQSGAGTLAEAIPGTCVVATGTTDASGTVTARTFQVQLNMGGNCTPPAGLGGGQGAGGGGRAGRGSPSPGADGGPPANFAMVRGKLTNVSGSTMTVQPQTGNPVMVVVSSATTVTRLVTSSSARLAVGECVNANGQRDSSGTVKARSILISAPGPNGCARGGGRPGGASPPSQGA